MFIIMKFNTAIWNEITHSNVSVLPANSHLSFTLNSTSHHLCSLCHAKVNGVK